MKHLKLISLVLLAVILSSTIFSQSNTCSSLEPICTDVGLDFPAQTGVADADATDPGNNYSCLISSPNPTWYYMEVSAAGGIDMDLSAGSDIDYALWGPFTSLGDAQANCNSYGSAIDCSYSPAATETVNLPSAQIGEVYVLLITNYASVSQQISLTQTTGSGATNCDILNPCDIISVDFNLTACSANLFDITGQVTFVDPPSSGTLTVTNCSGDQQVFNPPFNSPTNYAINGIVADATAGCSITAAFSDDATCTNSTITFTEPSCSCPAYAGTTTSILTGFGINNYILCDGDQIDINSVGDNVADPSWVDPGLMYAIYVCPPTPGLEPGSDPCYSGFVVGGPLNFTDINLGGSSGGLLANIIAAGVPIIGNTVYYAPMTAIDFGGFLYDAACVDVGEATAVTYLEPIVITSAADCQTGTVAVTISGGYPELFGGNYSISNVLPATASVSPNPIATSGGVITISGLQDGDIYSFDVTDDNGCPTSFSGGPFVALPEADAGVDDTECLLSYGVNAIASFGVGSWTGAGVTFSPNANTPNATATVGAAGSYTLTWTEDNGNGCVSSDDVVVQFSDLSYVEAVAQSTCGSADGGITLTASNGIPAYQYSIDNGTTFQAPGAFTGLFAGNYSVVVQDNIGCEVTGSASITDQGGPVINNVFGVDPLCNAGCDGSISITSTDATQFSIDNGVTFQGVNAFTNLCPGNYDVLVTNAVGCQANSSIILNDPAALSYSAVSTDILCSGQCTGEINVTAVGGTGVLQYSSDNGVTFGLNNVFTNLCVGNYDILIQDANSCQYSGGEPIAEPLPMEMTLGITNPLCNSSCDGLINSIPTGGDGNYTYTWSNGQNLPLILNLCSGLYSLNIQDGNGCFMDTSVNLFGPSSAVINNVIEVGESCPGMCDGSLEIVASNVSQYSIDGVSFVASSIFTNLCAGTYTVYAQDVNTCSTTAPAEILSPTVVGVSATAVSPICIDGSSFLDGTSIGGTQPFTYEWTDNTGAVIFATEDGSVSPVLDEVYTFTATDASGCSAATDVLVQVNDSLELSVFGDTPICGGSTSSLSALGSGGVGVPYTYTWDQGLGVGQNQIVVPTATTVYTVTLTDGCETPPISALVNITINSVPAISFTGDQLIGCLPVTANFTENLVPAGSSCLWNFGDGGTSNECGNPSYVFTEPGCWDVTLTVTTAEGCNGSVTIPNYVCVSGYPAADFSFGPQPTNVLSPVISFNNESLDASTYNWIFDTDGEVNVSQLENPTYTFPSENPGTYEVCLEAISQDGCVDTICENIVIDEEFIIYVPNAFTPGGSDLINNEFKPVIKGENPLKYSFMIFNRWGELIFESYNSSQGWNGYYNNVLSQQGVYVWKINCTDNSSKQAHEYIGHVTLLK